MDQTPSPSVLQVQEMHIHLSNHTEEHTLGLGLGMRGMKWNVQLPLKRLLHNFFFLTQKLALLNFFFLRWSFTLVTQAGVQW